MSWPVIIIVILVGLFLVALEIVALPGLISGICGVVLVGVGVWQTYAQYGALAGNIVLIGSVVVGVVMLALLMKSGTWRHFSLKEESDSKVNEVNPSRIRVGSRGTTITRLAPAGNARIDGEIVEVHSDGLFIDERMPVEVVEIEGYRILVRPIDEGATSAAPTAE